ncbi:hypothetical protein HDU96_005716 [Phlyctochytrium bullatum]|nr:hypothetical protein HDU96_005716 [Phlyctochytrium bullatum]
MALRALGLPLDATKDDLSTAIEKLQSSEVEERVEREKGCAAVLTSMNNWKTSEYVFLSFCIKTYYETVCCRTLAAYGADVLHVSSSDLPSLPGVDLGTSFGKRSCFLQLRNPSDKDRLRALIEEADVFVQAYRPGSLDALGFAPAEIAKIKPGIITVSISAYGVPDDPHAPLENRRGFDSLLQFATGIASEEGKQCSPSRPHAPLPAQALDHATGWLGALGVITALERRQVTGSGSHIRVSLSATSVLLESAGRRDLAEELDELDLKRDGHTQEMDVEGVGAVEFVKFPGGTFTWSRGPPSRLGVDEPRFH